MDSKHVFGGVVAAFLFGFVVLYSSRGRENIKASEKNRSKKTLKSSGNGVCRSNFAGNTDVIIVGAGVAGSALAYALAKDGWRVQVIERDLTEPDRIVGELLHAGGCIKLAELGLEDCLDGIDSQIVFSFAAVHKDGRRTAISYPSNACSRSFHHGRFIQKLREKAASLPNVKLEQGTVTSLVEENGSIKGVLYKTKAGQELAASASLTIVCDGCFSNLRRNLCNPKIEVPSYFGGLVLENYNLPYANRAYFILKDSIVVTYPISSNEIRCFVDVPGSKQPPISNGEMASYLKTVVAPQPTAFAINTLASTLHTVFSSSDQDPSRKEMKEAFFNYLSLGGVFSEGLMALLSGLNPAPLSLVFHCFAMLAYAVGRLLLPFPTPKRMFIAAKLILVGSGIIFPILKAEGIRATFFPVTMPAYYRTPPVQFTGERETGK